MKHSLIALGSLLLLGTVISVFVYDQETLFAPCEWCYCYGSYSTPESCEYFHNWGQYMNRLKFVPFILGGPGSIMVLVGLFKE